MMTRIELPFPPPLSACFTNAPKRGRVSTKRYLDWQTEALWVIRALRPKPVKGQCQVYVRLVAPDKRARDAGNMDKAIGDLLVKAGLIEDDSNHYLKRLVYEWRDDGPPCVVLIQPYDAMGAA